MTQRQAAPPARPDRAALAPVTGALVATLATVSAQVQALEAEIAA